MYCSQNVGTFKRHLGFVVLFVSMLPTPGSKDVVESSGMDLPLTDLTSSFGLCCLWSLVVIKASGTQVCSVLTLHETSCLGRTCFTAPHRQSL